MQPQVPAHGPEDHLGGEAEAAECPGGVSHDNTLGGMLAGALLLPGNAVLLNATDPSTKRAVSLFDSMSPASPVCPEAATKRRHRH